MRTELEKVLAHFGFYSTLLAKLSKCAKLVKFAKFAKLAILVKLSKFAVPGTFNSKSHEGDEEASLLRNTVKYNWPICFNFKTGRKLKCSAKNSYPEGPAR